MTGSLTFGSFMRKFVAHWLTAMSGVGSVLLTAASIYFSSPPLKLLFVLLAASCILVACYQVWRGSVRDLQTTLVELNSEIERLKRKDYDEEHKRLAEQKLGQLGETSLDLLYFLLHHGKTEKEDLRRHCLHDPIFNEAIQPACDQDLARGTMEPVPGRAGVRYFWEVNPMFEKVLQDLVGRRQPRFFR